MLSKSSHFSAKLGTPRSQLFQAQQRYKATEQNTSGMQLTTTVLPLLTSISKVHPSHAPTLSLLYFVTNPSHTFAYLFLLRPVADRPANPGKTLPVIHTLPHSTSFFSRHSSRVAPLRSTKSSPVETIFQRVSFAFQ